MRVWAPNARAVRLRTGGSDEPMQASAEGWWIGPDLPPDTDYAFVLDDEDEALPDPRSRRQPGGVHGPSRTYDQHAHAWQDAGWAGRDLSAAVFYELHIGTFTPGATFDAAIERLDHLVEL